MLEESVTNFDAVATLTGVDEENIITSMFLESIGIPKNITKVNRTSLLENIDDKQLSSIITPKRIAVDHVMHFVRGRVNAQDSNLEAMHHIANDRIETLQFEIKETSKLANRSLASLKLKQNILIAAIIRNNKTIFPTGEDVLTVGDRIVVITLLKNITRTSDMLAR